MIIAEETDPQQGAVTLTDAASLAASDTADAFAGALSGPSGTIVATNRALPSTVIKSKLTGATDVASRDLKEEWKLSMSKPIEALSERFARAKAGKHYVTVCPRVAPNTSAKLHGHLTEIDSNYTEQVCLKSHLPQVPDIVQWKNDHVVERRYSMSIKKC